MPKIVAEVTGLATPKMMQDNLRIALRKAGIPEYSWKERRAGFEVWHAEGNEGETHIIWHSFAEGAEANDAEERAGLEQCATALLENFWTRLHVPNRLKGRYGRTRLRVLYGLNWL